MTTPLPPFLLPLISITLCALLASAAAADEKPDHPEARAKLSGAWKGFAVEGKGENPDRGPVKLDLIITGETIHGLEYKGDSTIDHGAGAYTHGAGAYTLDPAAAPALLDASKTNERGRAESWVGIYRIEGDTLHWCVARKNRPTAFETVKGQFLLILKRAPVEK